MKRPFLFFTLKCSIIIYFAACTGINEYTAVVSATPKITRGAWRVNLFADAQNDRTANFTGCILKFNPSGKITAVKNGQIFTGNWSEDDILNRITININTKDPALTQLNDYWNISGIDKTRVSFKNTENPSNGWLQITSL